MVFIKIIFKGVNFDEKRKVIAFLMSLLMIFSMYIPQQTVLAANGIEVQFNNGNTGTSSNTINAKFKVVNNGSSSINLSQLKLRYYYTKMQIRHRISTVTMQEC